MIGALKGMLGYWLCVGLGLYAAEPTPAPVVSDQLAREINEAFHYAPASSDSLATDFPAAPADATVTLDKMVVTHYNATHTLELDMAEQARKIKDEASFWKSGVTFFKHEGPRVTTELTLKFDFKRGFDILSFSW